MPRLPFFQSGFSTKTNLKPVGEEINPILPIRKVKTKIVQFTIKTNLLQNTENRQLFLSILQFHICCHFKQIYISRMFVTSLQVFLTGGLNEPMDE